MKVKRAGAFVDMGGAASTPSPTPWVRPSDWLALPTVQPTDQKFVGLYAIYDHPSNFATFLAQVSGVNGTYTVDWGDGTVDVVNSGIVAQHQYDYASISSSTLSSRGYKQVIVTVTPMAGSNFLRIDLAFEHSIPSANSGNLDSGWLDILGASATVSNLNAVGNSSGATPRPRQMERFRWLTATADTTMSNMFYDCNSLRVVEMNLSGVTTVASMFSQCYALANVTLTNTSSVTNFMAMFQNCYALTGISALDTSAGTNFTSMFSSCYGLRAVPALDTHLGTTFNSMFANCYSITEIPALDTHLGTTFNSMFFNCYSLPEVPLINTAAGTNFGSMFSGCATLTTIPAISTAGGTDFSNMFQGCTALVGIPLIDTHLGTTFNSMFFSCQSLRTIPALNTGAATGSGFASMFSGCYSLVTVPLLNTAGGTSFTSMFSNCFSLQSVPALNVGNGTSLSSMFNSCAALAKCDIRGAKVSISFQNNSLSAAELDRIYTNLASGVTGQTITVTGNYGTTSDTPSIATAKGWTVTGS